MRISGWAGVAAMALVGVMASSALAQPPEGGRGRGAGFGFGGGMGQMAPVQLAANAAVQKDLGVTEDQAAKLKTLNEEASTELRAAFGGGPGGGGPGGGGNLSEEERAARAAKRAETVRNVNAKFKPKLEEVLNATQMERLGQIGLQAQGGQVYNDENVAKTLNITKEQKEKLASINTEYQGKMREIFSGGPGGDQQERMTKMRELNQSRDKDLAAVLTADQQKQLATMKGKEFDVAQLRTFGGPGGGARPGGGRGNRPPQ